MQLAVNRNGKLKEEFLPAVYFDTSILIDYWMVEGVEYSIPPEDNPNFDSIFHGPVVEVMRDLLRSDSRLKKMEEIRKKVIDEEIKVTPVTSNIALWELQEWVAESGFKQLGAEITGAVFLQKKGKKEIGDLLKKAYELWESEGTDNHHHPITGTSGLEILMQSTWTNASFAYFHGLRGIMFAELENFCWPPKRSRVRMPFPDPKMLAYLQLGLADILHVLIAHHLGCQYFASLDSDFRRASRFIEEAGMKVLSNPEQIIAVL